MSKIVKEIKNMTRYNMIRWHHQSSAQSRKTIPLNTVVAQKTLYYHLKQLFPRFMLLVRQ